MYYWQRERKKQNESNGVTKAGMVVMYACSQIARQQAVKEFAVSIRLKTSECKTYVPQHQTQGRLYNSLAVDRKHNNYGNKI